MFGYVICSKEDLTKEESDRYQSAYCGLCRELRNKYGQAARMCLSYDMTFLALFLSSLYEPEEQQEEMRCVVHPVKKRPILNNTFIEYAADMSILVTYFQCLDDWKDEHKYRRYKYSKELEKFLPDIQKKYPRQYMKMREKVEELSALEKKSCDVSDEIVKCSGELIAELFVYKEDYWSGYLRKFGYELGRFIYLMDAVIDYDKDKKSGNFNPFIKMQMNLAHAEDVLKVMIGNAMEQYDMLPIVQDERIFRNILYGGIWTQYRSKINGKERPNGSL